MVGFALGRQGSLRVHFMLPCPVAMIFVAVAMVFVAHCRHIAQLHLAPRATSQVAHSPKMLMLVGHS